MPATLPTLPDKANVSQIADAVRALLDAVAPFGNIQITRGDTDEVITSDGNITFQLAKDSSGGGNGLTVQSIDFCEGGQKGTRQVLCGPFVPNAS